MDKLILNVIYSDILLLGEISKETAKIVNNLTTSSNWAMYKECNTVYQVIATDGNKSFISDGTNVTAEDTANLFIW